MGDLFHIHIPIIVLAAILSGPEEHTIVKHVRLSLLKVNFQCRMLITTMFACDNINKQQIKFQITCRFRKPYCTARGLSDTEKSIARINQSIVIEDSAKPLLLHMHMLKNIYLFI